MVATYFIDEAFSNRNITELNSRFHVTTTKIKIHNKRPKDLQATSSSAASVV